MTCDWICNDCGSRAAYSGESCWRCTPGGAAPSNPTSPPTLSLSVAVAAMEAGKECVDVDGDRWRIRHGQMQMSTKKASAGGGWEGRDLDCYCVDGWRVAEAETFGFAEARRRWDKYTPKLKSCVTGLLFVDDKRARIPASGAVAFTEDEIDGRGVRRRPRDPSTINVNEEWLLTLYSSDSGAIINHANGEHPMLFPEDLLADDWEVCE